MTPDQIAYLIFLAVLLTGLVLFSVPRRAFNKLVRIAGAWVLIYVGVTVGYGVWEDIRTEAPDQTFAGSIVSVPRGHDGHYHLTLSLEDTPVQFIIDTGATDIVLSRQDAERVGIDATQISYDGIAKTANGLVRTGRVHIAEVRLGQIVDRDVRASVNDAEMATSLLGMRYLERFQRVSIEGGQLVLER